MDNKRDRYEVPAIVDEGNLEIRAGSQLGFPEDPLELEF